MSNTLDKLRKVADEAKVLADKANRTNAEQSRLDGLVKYGNSLKAIIQQERTITEFETKVSEMVGGVGPETVDGFAPGVGRITGKALYDVWEANAKSGGIPSGNDFRVPGVRAKDVDAGGLLTPAQRDPEEYTLPMKPSLLTAIVPAKTVEGTNDFSYLVQKERTNNAAVVADTAQKPTSVYSFEEKTGTLETIAHMSEFIKNRLLQDKANLQSWLYGEMALGLDLAAEAEIVAAILGDGDVQEQVFVTDFLTTARKAVTKLQAKYVVADFLAVSLEDAEALDLTTDGIGRFYFAGPKATGSSPLWSVPVIANDAIPAGMAIMGSAQAGLRRYVNPMADFAIDTLTEFDTNQTRSRLEQRSKSVVVRPFAVVVIETAVGSGS